MANGTVTLEPTWGEFIRLQQERVMELIDDYRAGKLNDKQYSNHLNGEKLLDKSTNTFLSGVRQIRGQQSQKLMRGFLGEGKKNSKSKA